MDNWNNKAKLCGNCAHWPLGGYQHKWPGAQPSGIGGHHCNGEVSECHAKSPIGENRDRSLSGGAIWPTTKREDSCGDYKPRVPWLKRLFGKRSK